MSFFGEQEKRDFFQKRETLQQEALEIISNLSQETANA